MTPNHAVYVTAVASEWSAVGTVVTALIAAYAATTWRSGLKWQREDECISALHEWSGATHRVISRAENGHEFWTSFDLAWLSWREFRKTYAVVCRYRRAPAEVIDKSLEVLNALGQICKNGQFDRGFADQLRADIQSLVKKVEEILE